MYQRKKKKPDQLITDVKEEKWYRVGYHNLHICCDCGLVHNVTHRFEDGSVWERWTRNEHATRQQRKKG